MSARIFPRAQCGLDHGDHGHAREQELLGKAPLRNEPVDLVADDMLALFEAAVVGIGGIGGHGVTTGRWRADGTARKSG